jgi:hypothetical protein
MPRKKFWQKFGYESEESMIEKKAGAWEVPPAAPVYSTKAQMSRARRRLRAEQAKRFQDVMPEPPPFEADDEGKDAP